MAEDGRRVSIGNCIRTEAPITVRRCSVVHLLENVSRWMAAFEVLSRLGAHDRADASTPTNQSILVAGFTRPDKTEEVHLKAGFQVSYL